MTHSQGKHQVRRMHQDKSHAQWFVLASAVDRKLESVPGSWCPWGWTSPAACVLGPQPSLLSSMGARSQKADQCVPPLPTAVPAGPGESLQNPSLCCLYASLLLHRDPDFPCLLWGGAALGAGFGLLVIPHVYLASALQEPLHFSAHPMHWNPQLLSHIPVLINTSFVCTFSPARLSLNQWATLPSFQQDWVSPQAVGWASCCNGQSPGSLPWSPAITGLPLWFEWLFWDCQPSVPSHNSDCLKPSSHIQP